MVSELVAARVLETVLAVVAALALVLVVASELVAARVLAVVAALVVA